MPKWGNDTSSNPMALMLQLLGQNSWQGQGHGKKGKGKYPYGGWDTWGNGGGGHPSNSKQGGGGWGDNASQANGWKNKWGEWVQSDGNWK